MHSRLVLAGLLASILPAAAAQPYDGDWTMSASTQSGSCSAYSFDVGIAEGRVQTPPNVPVAGTGRVSPKGIVNVQFTAGANVIAATGQATKQSASGRWNAPTLACSGVWSAQRR